MSNKSRGEWAELQFAADARKYGWDVFIPFGDDCDFDMIITKQSLVLTIQVKSTYTDLNGTSKWNIGKGHDCKQRYNDDVDWFALWDDTIKHWRFFRPSNTNGVKTFRVKQTNTNNLENWNDLENDDD